MGFWKGKRVLITGISGFAGSYLAKELVREGADVFGLLRFRADRVYPKNLADKSLMEAVRLIEGDITDLYSLLSVMDRTRPEVVFHLAAQSFVHRSFIYCSETVHINSLGTANVLEAVRLKAPEARVIFAGSSEEYGMVFYSEDQYRRVTKNRSYFPDPVAIPEVPIKETNPLRPLSPYAVSKVHGDFLCRQYHITNGMATVVSRAFNHEGAGRGGHFVTSVVAMQIARLLREETEAITIGNVSAFRDWSHVSDIVRGYMLLAEKGTPGQVYNQGSERTNSVLSLILLGLAEAGYKVHKLRSIKGDKALDEPGELITLKAFGLEFPGTRVDEALLFGGLDFVPEDEGLILETERGEIRVLFDQERMRPSDVPILLCDATRAKALGFKVTKTLSEIIKDQINYYLAPENIEAFMK